MSAAVNMAAVPASTVVTNDEGGASVLYRGIRNMLRCDDAEVVRGIARYVVAQHPALRLLSTVIESTRGTFIPGVVALAGCLRAFFAVGSVPGTSGGVWIARLSNERRAIEPFIVHAPDLQWHEVRFVHFSNMSTAVSLRQNMRPRRMIKLARRLHRRYEFFKVLRVFEFIGYYQRYSQLFRDRNYQIALTSNHSNPHGVAFNLAARRFAVPIVLVTHGMPVRPVARLSYDLAVVHCAAAHETYVAEGCQLKQVLIHGRRQDWAPMPSRLPEVLTVGLFLCKDVNEARLRTLVAELSQHEGVRQLLIRPHPKNLWRGMERWIASLNDPRIVLSSRGQVMDDIRKTDIVLAGNSSVLIDAVVAGRPAGFVSGLDHGPPDVHRFVAQGSIYPVIQSDQGLTWDPASLLSFYQRPEWPSLLRAFANIEAAHAGVVEDAVTIMHHLARQ